MYTVRSSEIAHTLQALVRQVEHDWSMTTLAPMYFGFVVPADADMVALSREYYSSGKSIKVDLYEASFTGGTPLTQMNRNLRFRASPYPMQFLHSVTPGALTDRIAGFEAEVAGNVSVGRSGEVAIIVHQATKSYVLAIENMVAGAADYRFTMNYRMAIAGEGR